MEENKLVLGIDESPKKWYQWALYALQHVLAMFVANALIAIIIFSPYGINMVPSALVAAGLGTIYYLVITRFRSPVFLGSSAALIPVMAGCLSLGWTNNAGEIVEGAHGNFTALVIGLLVVGAVYIFTSIIIRKTGVAWLQKLLPPVIVGPVIMIIGLSLATFATQWSDFNGPLTDGSIFNPYSFIVAIVTMLIIVLVSHFSKKTLKTIPFLIGILGGYVLSLIFSGFGQLYNIEEMKLINFEIFNHIDWLPTFAFTKVFEGFDPNGFNAGQLPYILITAIPVAMVAMCEHIGDHLNLSNMVDRDLLKDPGLDRTLLGDGLATSVGGLIGGMGNTTYGENVAVIGVTKVASSRVILPAAILAIILGFCGPLMTWVTSIPYAVFGGAALVLYGFIAVSGIKTLQTVDLQDNKNLLVVSVILVAGIGGLFIQIGGFHFAGTALAMILGMALYGILNFKRKNKKR